MGGLFLIGKWGWAETFLTIEQAQRLLWGPDTALEPMVVTLSREQMESIEAAAKVRVRYAEIRAWKTPENGWFLLDQVIGKHENIDLAVAIAPDGKVMGLEVLTYRETYGDEIRNAKWRAQFIGRDNRERLRLGKQIRNITGATLSCRHVTDGINRLVHTWDQVLRLL